MCHKTIKETTKQTSQIFVQVQGNEYARRTYLKIIPEEYAKRICQGQVKHRYTSFTTWFFKTKTFKAAEIKVQI